MKMFVRDNLVHGDLHGGNILYDETSRVATLLDAGLTNSIEAEDDQTQFARFMYCACIADLPRWVGSSTNCHLFPEPSYSSTNCHRCQPSHISTNCHLRRSPLLTLPSPAPSYTTRVTELLLNFDSRWPEVPVDEREFKRGVKEVLGKWVGEERTALGASLDPHGNPIAVGDLMGGLLQPVCAAARLARLAPLLPAAALLRARVEERRKRSGFNSAA